MCAQSTAPSHSGATTQATKTFGQLSQSAQKASDENRLDDAVRLYSKALAIRPPGLRMVVARDSAYDRNSYAEAAAAFEKLIGLQPKNGMAHAMLGLCELSWAEMARLCSTFTRAPTSASTMMRHLEGRSLHEGVLLQRKGSFKLLRTLENCVR